MTREMHPIEPEELMAYLDGELAPARASEAAAHLSRCRECQSAAADMQGLSRNLLTWQVDEPGPAVERAVSLAPLPPRDRPIWKRRAPWVLALAAAVIGGMVLVRIPGQHVVLPPHRRGATLNLPTDKLDEKGDAEDQALTPLIARTAEITLSTAGFAQARASLDEILQRHGGHVGSMTLQSPADAGQTLDATLRIPASQLDSALAEVRRLGRVQSEQQNGEEVTRQTFDLEARLANSRHAEQRLSDILLHGTGKISDILAVETEMARVRGEIERMEAERKNLGDRVSFAVLEIVLKEEYKANLGSSAPSIPVRLRNATVQGYRNVGESLTGFAAFLLSYAPVWLFWAALLFFPVRYLWRRLR